MPIGIVADGGPRVGLGHVARCLALAQAFRKITRSAPTFIVDDPSCVRWIHRHGFPTSPSFQTKQWDLLIADSYRFKARDWSALRRHARQLLVWDDEGALPSVADAVLNSSAGATRGLYRLSPRQQAFLGPTFHPLRNEFLALKPAAPRPTVRRVLVILGGGPGGALAPEIAAMAADGLPGVSIDVVIGPLASIAGKRGARARFHRAPKDLPALMKKSDIALSAGGQTLYELAYLGIPTIAITIADNQKRNVAGLADRKALVSIGRPDKKRFKQTLRTALVKLASNAALRTSLSAHARRCVDGKGGGRVVQGLKKFL